MNGLTTIESKRRAVAPIIATLLMVAIAVVGGILIFVFTQGFFADDQVVGPTVDNIRIFGYNATDDGNVMGNFEGHPLLCPGGTAGASLQSGDCIVLFVENLGDKPVAIQAVRIFGETYNHGAGVTAETCETTNNSFNIFDNTATPVVISIIEPNTQAGICVEYAGNNVKPGRTIPVQVETSNGQSSQINIINGAARGQQQ